MRRFARGAFVLVVAAAAGAAGVLLITGGGEGGHGTPTGSAGAPSASSAGSAGPQRSVRPTPAASQPAHHRHARGQISNRQAVRQAVHESRSARLAPAQRRVAAVVREYVAAIDARNGQRACALFVPGGLAKLDFPRRRGGCAGSLSASIGYRDPRGFPIFESSRVARVPRVAIQGQTARVTATTVTRFAGNREPSVEDDLIYLRRRARRWLIVQPSATLYRAIGVGNISPQALAPP